MVVVGGSSMLRAKACEPSPYHSADPVRHRSLDPHRSATRATLATEGSAPNSTPIPPSDPNEQPPSCNPKRNSC
eukprot:112173-Amphidinium_carterae.1